MVTYAQVRYTDLGDYVWVVCIYIYIWLIREAEVCVILVGDFTSSVKRSSVVVESQEECGFSQSILKSPSTRISAWGLTVWLLSIKFVQSCQTIHKKQKGFCIKYTQKYYVLLYLLSVQAKYIQQGHFQGLDGCVYCQQ